MIERTLSTPFAAFLQRTAMPRPSRLLLVLLCTFLIAVLASGCSTRRPSGSRGTASYTVRGKTYHPLKSAAGFTETGTASWYGPGFHGKTTSNGERYNQNSMTAAHKLLPFDTKLRVTNLENGRSVIVRINDRGPFVGSRIIDLSRAAARQLNMLGPGTARVRIVALEDGRKPSLLTPDGDMLGLFYIQIGAFRELPRARALAETMRRRGYGCRIAEHDGNALHFVQIGPYLSKSEADRASRPLLKQYRELFTVAE